MNDVERTGAAAWWIGEGDGSGATVARAVIAAAIAITVAATILLTVPDLDAGLKNWLVTLRGAAVVLLSIEYTLRLWRSFGAGGGSRLAYMFSFLGVVDLMAVLPFWLSLAAPIGGSVTIGAGLAAVLKIARFAPGLGLILTVIHNESRPLLAGFAMLGILLVLASGAMYLIEREAQPQLFSSIPSALWWGIVTVASVGYGDMTPVTPLGRVVGGLVIVLGLGVFAVPVGILATGFAGELRRRDFLVTWQTVAKLPLFAGLAASQIGEIARLLRPIVVPPNTVVVRRGDSADAMFFIMEGEVEVDVAPHPARLHSGQYFGEIALLREMARTATVTTLSECRLLSLGVHDFRRLMERFPDIKASIAREVERRQRQSSTG